MCATLFFVCRLVVGWMQLLNARHFSLRDNSYISGYPNCLRPVCRNCDVGVVLARETEPLVHPGLFGVVLAWICVRLFAGGVAFWLGRGGLVRRGPATLVVRTPADFLNKRTPVPVERGGHRFGRPTAA